MAYLNENYLKLQAGLSLPRDRAAGKRILRGPSGRGAAPDSLRHRRCHRTVAAGGDRGHASGGGRTWASRNVSRLWPRAGITNFSAQRSRSTIIAIAGSRSPPTKFLSPTDRSRDCGYILDILGDQNKIAITDPVYPVYVDTNVMAGHTGRRRRCGGYEGIIYLPCTADNGFVPEPPNEHVDLVYLCFPNNPTGAVASRDAADALGRVCART